MADTPRPMNISDACTEIFRLEGMVRELRAEVERLKSGEELPLHIIRKWPDGFDARLQHVWLDVVSFIPEVKLYDLQRVLAEFGFTMKVYDDRAVRSSASGATPNTTEGA